MFLGCFFFSFQINNWLKIKTANCGVFFVYKKNDKNAPRVVYLSNPQIFYLSFMHTFSVDLPGSNSVDIFITLRKQTNMPGKLYILSKR